jgi:hypothetical protein
MTRYWTCQRQKAGKKCGTRNLARKRLCGGCGKAKPARKRPAHMAALGLSYEDYVAINGGSEACGICGKPRSPTRRHARDHEHKGDGKPRGILCWKCNNALPDWMDARWLRLATYYLERAEGS